MACDLDILINRKETAVEKAAEKENITFEISRFAISKARNLTARINKVLGFLGVRADSLGDGSGVIVKDRIGIRKAAEQERENQLAVEGDLDKGTMAQLTVDEKRKKIQPKVETFVKDILKKLGIQEKRFEEFKIKYKQKHGKDVDMIAIADLFENIIYVSHDKKDGTTLSEEAMHFITEIFWDDPMIENIRTLSTDGRINDFEKTDIWREESQAYFRQYDGDRTKVEKEIIGKLLARTIYDKFYKDSNTYKVLSVLDRTLGKFLRIIFRKIRLVREITPDGITAELNRLLEGAVVRMNTDSFKSSLTPRVATSGEIKVKTSAFSEKAAMSLVAHLKARLKQLEEKKTGLYNEILKNRAKDLVTKIGAKTYSQYKKDLEDLQDKAKTAGLTLVEEESLNDLAELLKLIKLNNEDTANLKRIQELNRQISFINAQLSKQNFEAGIFMFFYGPTGDGDSGAIEDLNEILKAVLKIQGKIDKGDDSIDFDLDMYSRIAHAVSFYSPIIKTLNNMFREGLTFTDLSAENNQKLKEVIGQLNNTHIDELERFLYNQTSDQIKKIFEEFKTVNPELAYRINDDIVKLHNSGLLAYLFGAAKNAKEDLLGIFTKKLATTLQKVHQLTNSSGVDLFSKLKDLNIDYDAMVEQHNGKPSFYYLSEYNISNWEEERKKAREKIIEEVEEQSRKDGYNVRIPLNREKRHEVLEAYKFNAPSTLTPYQKHINKLNTLYKRKWAKWFNENTMTHPRVNEIIQEREKSMNKTQFNAWRAKNIRTVSFFNGSDIETYTYYTGELSIPSNGKVNSSAGASYHTKDYTNPEYEKLKREKPDTFKALELIKEQHQKALQVLPVNYSYELVNRLPQISKSFSEVAFKGFRDVKSIGDQITDIYADKIDDPLYAERIDIHGTSELLERPRIRFIQKLENPEVISKDLVKSVVLFTEMSNNYHELMKVLPELGGMIEVVRRAERETTTTGNVFKRVLGSSEQGDDFLLKKFEHLMKVHVQGEIFSKEDSALDSITKLLQTLRSYITKTNLMGNIPSALTGFFSAHIDNLIESILGKYNSIDAQWFAKKELYNPKESVMLMKDFNSPIKSSKISIIGQDIGIVDDVSYTFGNLNSNKFLRAIGKVIDYGEWRLADILLKYEIMISTAYGIRFIDGKYYTQESWKRFVEENPTEKLEKYAKAPNMWDSMEIVNGKIKYKSHVSQEAIEFFQHRSKTIASNIDTQPLDIDKGAAYNHRILQFTTIHTGWLFQMLERSTKKRHFNYLTNEYEIGWWRVFFQKGLYNPINWARIRYLYQQASSEEREGMKRILAMATSTSLLFGLVYLLQAMLLSDDEDENPEFKYMTYILTRIEMEKEAQVSISDVVRYLVNPVAGLEKIDDYFGLLTLPFRLVADDGEPIEKGFYEGYTKTQQTAIKSVPWLKGMFETAFGGYVNEMTGKGAETIAVSIHGKNEFIKNKIVNTGDWYDFFQLPFGSLSKILGKTLVGYPLATSMSEYPESAGVTKLPTKKANEEED